MTVVDPIAAGNAGAPPAAPSAPSIDEIVDSFDFGQDGAPSDAVPPADASSGEPAKAPETPAAGSTPADPAAPASADKPAPYTPDEIRKITVQDIQHPKFDWSRVPEGDVERLKAVQAILTKGYQDLAAQRQALQGKQQPTTPKQPDGEADPVQKENQEIVAQALRAMGVPVEMVRDLTEEHLFTVGVRVAAAQVPEYVEDDAFREAANQVIASDRRLAAMAESGDPALIATAVELAGLRTVKAGIASREQAIKARETALAQKEQALQGELDAVRKHKEDLNRQPGSAAAGRSQAGTPKAPNPYASTGEIVDDVWPSGTASLLE